MSNQRKREPDEKELEILKKLAANEEVSKMSARQRFSCSARVLDRWLEMYDIEWVSPKLKKTEQPAEVVVTNEDILQKYKEVKRAEATATSLGVSVNRVYSVLRENSIKYGSSHMTHRAMHTINVTPKEAPPFTLQFDPKGDVSGWSWICDELDAQGWVAANDDAQARDKITQNLAKFQARKQQAYI